MNHLKQIGAKLPEYGIDAMLLSSAPGEFYGVGFHGEGYHRLPLHRGGGEDRHRRSYRHDQPGEELSRSAPAGHR